jgi:hypothetical protein
MFVPLRLSSSKDPKRVRLSLSQHSSGFQLPLLHRTIRILGVAKSEVKHFLLHRTKRRLEGPPMRFKRPKNQTVIMALAA